MTSDELVARLNRYDMSALEQLRVFVQAEPAAAAERIKGLLLSERLREEAGVTIELLTLLCAGVGLRDVEEWLRNTWPKMTENPRGRIAYALSKADLLSTELAMSLFLSSSSTVADRHSLAAGLAMSARDRRCERLVLDLLSRIGDYPDAYHQTTLQEFKESVVTSFADEVD